MRKLATKPRYLLLAETLRERIARGDLSPGDRLPSETQLCHEHGVSRGTVVRAVEQLVQEGTVHRRQGAGSFVANPSLHRRAGKLLSFSESATSEGFRSTQSLYSMAPATPAQERQFHSDGPAVFLCRLRYLDNVPCAVHRSIIPASIARDVAALNGKDPGQLRRPDFSLYQALEEAGHTVREADERVATRLAHSEELTALKINHPAPVMVVFRRSYSSSGRLVEAVEAVYHGEYYTFDFRLTAAPSAVSGRSDANVFSLGGRIAHPTQ